MHFVNAHDGSCMHVSERNVAWPMAFLNTSLIQTNIWLMTLCKVMWMTEYLIVTSPAFYNWKQTLSDIPHKFLTMHTCMNIWWREKWLFYQQMQSLSIMSCCQWQKHQDMASMKHQSYLCKIVIDLDCSFLLNAECQCVAAREDKCNNVAAILFALDKFRESQMKTNCTGQPQQWHLPSRTSKKRTKPQTTGETLWKYTGSIRNNSIGHDFSKFLRY